MWQGFSPFLWPAGRFSLEPVLFATFFEDDILSPYLWALNIICYNIGMLFDRLLGLDHKEAGPTPELRAWIWVYQKLDPGWPRDLAQPEAGPRLTTRLGPTGSLAYSDPCERGATRNLTHPDLREPGPTRRGNLHTSTAPLPMRYTTMGYTSMRYTSTALYFYKQFTQAPNKIFLKHFKQKICNKYF